MAETIAIIDYGAGNLHSAEKTVVRAAADAGLDHRVIVTSDAKTVRRADRVVLPGVGAFGACRQGLAAIPGMQEALKEAVIENAAPFLGICVGMQLMADRGFEHGDHEGFGWIAGDVTAIKPQAAGLKIPHMGWNEIVLTDNGRRHPALKGLAPGDHAYFVHSYHLVTQNMSQKLAYTEYGHPITAIVGWDNLLGFQFHPEKSQAVGRRLITAFLQWKP